MVSVPGFLLRRLFVKKSLKSTPDGFEFQLMNRLGSGYAHGMAPIIVDGEEVDIDKAFFLFEDREIPFASVTRENTFTIAMNKAITVRVEGVNLEPGPHKIGMGFEVPGLGSLKFDFTDVVDGE